MTGGSPMTQETSNSIFWIFITCAPTEPSTSHEGPRGRPAQVAPSQTVVSGCAGCPVALSWRTVHSHFTLVYDTSVYKPTYNSGGGYIVGLILGLLNFSTPC